MQLRLSETVLGVMAIGSLVEESRSFPLLYYLFVYFIYSPAILPNLVGLLLVDKIVQLKPPR